MWAGLPPPLEEAALPGGWTKKRVGEASTLYISPTGAIVHTLQQVSPHMSYNRKYTRVPVCCWSPCSGAQIPANCVLACYWSMAVCYWGSSQSQTTTQLAGIWAPLHGDQQHTGTLVIVSRLLRALHCEMLPNDSSTPLS